MKKRILLITNIPSPYTVDLFYYINENYKIYDFSILYTSYNEDNRQWSVDNNKLVNSFFVDSRVIKIKTKYDYRYIHIPRNISKTIFNINPDIIIAWEYNYAAINALLWCLKNNRKYISLTEGTLLTESSLNIVQKLSRVFIKNKADAFLVSGIKAKEKLLAWGVDNSKIFTELLTVDCSELRVTVRKPKNNTILYVGSMVERKGVDLLLRSLPFLKNDYELRIVGNGTEKDLKKLKDISVELNVADKIKWLGFKEGKELVEEYGYATVFVLPTREDCFGLVLLEALAAGVPIVSSKFADGAYDIVEEGKTGFIVDPYLPNELAGKIDYILEHPEFQKECYENSREVLVKFDFSNVSQGFIDAINYVTEG